MLGKAVKTLRRMSLTFGMSESRLAQKREREGHLAQKIKDALKPSYIKVDDITIGPNSCGQMYNIKVESELFKGKSLVQQHQMVTNCISEQLKTIHGYNLKTKVAEDSQPQPATDKEPSAEKDEPKSA